MSTARAACDAVFPSPYRGGGTLVIVGHRAAVRRPADRDLQACLGAPEDPDPALTQGERGADALLVMSTGIGVTILGETAYARYANAHQTRTAPLRAARPRRVLLPSGPVVGAPRR